MDAVGEAYGKIGVAVVVVIAGDAAEARAGKLDAGLLRDVGEFSVAEIVEEARGAVVGRADEEEVGLAVVVEIEEAGAGGGGERGAGVCERLCR